MLLRDPPKADDGRRSRDLKVKVPARLHMHLHSLKIVTGRSISGVVAEALARYFEREAAGDQEGGVPASADGAAAADGDSGRKAF